MPRRANGEGTIRKRGDGRWEGRYYDPESDKQRSIYGKTQKEVREKLTGIRKSEAIALKWKDFSGNFDFVHINSTYVQYTQDKHMIKAENGPKTRSSIRTIPLQEQIVTALQTQKEKARFIAKQFT